MKKKTEKELLKGEKGENPLKIEAQNKRPKKTAR